MIETRFVAKVILLDEAGYFLSLKRSGSHPTLAHYLDIPGGMIEQHEEPGQAVRREIQEETGLLVDELEVKYAVTMKINNMSFPTLLYVGSVSGKQPEVVLSYEHESYEWVPIENLAKVEPHLAPTYREALKYLTQNGLFIS